MKRKDDAMRIRILTLVLIILTAFIANLAIAQETEREYGIGFSLKGAQEYALENSPVLLNSERDVEIAKKMVWENTATGLPHAILSGTYTYNPRLSGLTEIIIGGEGDTTSTGGGFFDMPGLDINDLKTTFFADIQVSQLIFSGQYLVGLRAAKVYANLAGLTHDKSRIGLVQNITDSYFTVLVARRSKVILDSSYAVLQKTLYETEEMHKNGLVESTDVDQIRILASNVKSALSVAERQITITEKLLKFQMGLPIDQPVRLTDEIDPLVERMNLEASMLDSFTLEQNIDYRMLSTRENLMKLNMQVQMASYLPSLSGYYNRHEDFDNNFFNNSSPNMYGLSLNFPLWSSGQRMSRVGQTRLEYMKAQTNRAMAAESLRIEYEGALSGLLSANDVYHLQKENRDLALRIYRSSLVKYREGIGSSLDLNQTQSQYFEAESAYFSAVIALVTAKSNLESLLKTDVLQ